MRNGCGDHFFAHFTPAGCWLKGFAHESRMSPFSQGNQDLALLEADRIEIGYPE